MLEKLNLRTGGCPIRISDFFVLPIEVPMVEETWFILEKLIQLKSPK